MTKMTEDLLVIARSENRSGSAMKRLDIAEVVRKTAERLRPLASDKSIKIGVSLEAPLYVQGNETGLERVITNLLQNAIEHTPKNGSITLTTSMEADKAIVSVSDTGSGIGEKDLPHIFERFYKGESASGSGLGLSIVKELVNQHKGEIDIKSTNGKGTTITMKLPVLS
jgi:two-component system sensor histidine kinase ResE